MQKREEEDWALRRTDKSQIQRNRQKHYICFFFFCRNWKQIKCSRCDASEEQGKNEIDGKRKQPPHHSFFVATKHGTECKEGAASLQRLFRSDLREITSHNTFRHKGTTTYIGEALTGHSQRESPHSKREQPPNPHRGSIQTPTWNLLQIVKKGKRNLDR